MDTRHLKAFLTIAEHRSISRACVSLGLSQPSLSQILLRLEDEVGAQLFNRTARGVTLTEPGRIFQEHARQILRGMDQALEDVRRLDMSVSGQVSLSMPPTIAMLIGTQLLDELAAHAPKVKLRLAEAFHGTIRGWLEPGRIDLGIMYDLGTLRHLSTRPLVSEELFLAGPAGQFPMDGEDPADVPLAALHRYPLVTPGMHQGMRELIEQQAARLGFAPDIAQDSDSLWQTVALVEAGRFNAILPYPVLAEAIAQERLSAARIGGGALRRKLCFVRNPAQLATHASLRVEDHTVRIIAGLIESGAWQARLETQVQ